MISLSDFLTESLNDMIVPLKYNSFMHYNIDRERISMPQIPHERVDDFLIHFSDKYRVQKCTMDICNIKPSQKEMDVNKVIGMYKDRSFKPTDNVFVVSKDNYLVDGHHRWAAGLEEDDTQKVNVYKINLPIKKLLWILNKMKITNKEGIDKNIVESLSEQFDVFEESVLADMAKVFIDKTKLLSDVTIKDALSFLDEYYKSYSGDITIAEFLIKTRNFNS